jgi:hypothetical protein
MKQKRAKQGRLFLILCQVIALALLVFSVYRNNQIKNLVDDPANLKQVKVLDLYCHSTGASTMKIAFDGQSRIVSVGRELCLSLTEGDTVELYYHKSSDFFLEPDNHEYERGIYALVAFLVLSLIPWRKFKK